MSKSKLTENQWAALFAEEASGVPRKVLSAKYGVHTGTINRQASIRGCLKRQTGAPDQRRKPPEGWPPDRIIPQSPVGMTPALWDQLIARYLAGESTVDLALEYGVSEGSITSAAFASGRQKKDTPGAVYRMTGPKPLTLDDEPDGRLRLSHGGRGFTLDRENPQAAIDALFASAALAADEGRREACASDLRMAEMIRRIMIGRRANDRSTGVPDRAAVADIPVPDLRLRTAQCPPDALPDGTDWSTWLFLGGRGAGKTLAGASWLADQAEALGANGRLALIGPTLHDVREVMIEGVSGIRSLPRWTADTRPVFESSRRRLIFPGGCIAYAFSAEDPDSLRGPQFSAAWADEFCVWPGTGTRGAAETLALLRMGLRLPGAPRISFAAQAASDRVASDSPPRLLVTTTPRPTRALIALRDEPTCVLTHAGTSENADNLASGFLDGLLTLYGGTRREAQELDGKIVDLDGALFTAEMMAMARSRGDVGSSRPEADSPLERSSSRPEADSPLEKVIIAIDPTTTATGDACGIVVAASRRRSDDVREAVILADRSMAGLSPDGWARRAVQAANDFDATAIVAEVNQGGEMVAQVLRTAGCTLKVTEVRATRGKRVRAEPVAALYEQGRVHHRPADGRALDRLEEELMAFGTEAESSGSLDRADALVWAITHLLIDAKDGERGPRYRTLSW